MKKRTIALAAIAALAAGVWLNNSSLLSARSGGRPIVLAHRGLAQGFSRENLGPDTCTAARMLPPRHAYLENTLASINAAFALGADVVEIDVHLTADGRFAVFHDWTVDCRTEGKGRTRDHTLAELQKLDAGYGYTADGGATFPFRGKGVGQIRSLDEVLERFPERRFHINVKSNDPEKGKALAARLAMLSPPERQRLTVVGGSRPVAEVENALPDMRTLTRDALTACVLRYAALGWSGYVPAA